MYEALRAWTNLRAHEITCGVWGEEDADRERRGKLKARAIVLTSRAVEIVEAFATAPTESGAASG